MLNVRTQELCLHKIGYLTFLDTWYYRHISACMKKALTFSAHACSNKNKLSERVDSALLKDTAALHRRPLQESSSRPLLQALTASLPTTFTLPPTPSRC